MFIFSTSGELLRDIVDSPTLTVWGQPELHDVGDASVIWIDDGFTYFRHHNGGWEVGHRWPGGDLTPISGVRRTAGSKEIELFRRWSGEFCVYYSADKALYVASHLKLLLLLNQKFKRSPRRLEPAHEITFRRSGNQWKGTERKATKFSRRFLYDFDSAATEVRKLTLASVNKLPNGTALLLSGGIDSSAIAAAAAITGKNIRAFTFATSMALQPNSALENDVACATRVAAHLGIKSERICIKPKRLIDNLSMAVFLSESSRGTIIDDSVALIEVAKHLNRLGYRVACMGEAADDLFGGFKFAFRYYRGQQLRRYYRQQLERDLPNELAIIQNNFSYWGISIVQPFWTEEIMRIGYNLPLRLRIDHKYLMKSVLRAAFRAELPKDIVLRPKCVTRDANGVRNVMEGAFGESRERYRPVFNEIFRNGTDRPKRLVSILRRSIHRKTAIT